METDAPTPSESQTAGFSNLPSPGLCLNVSLEKKLSRPDIIVLVKVFVTASMQGPPVSTGSVSLVPGDRLMFFYRRGRWGGIMGGGNLYFRERPYTNTVKYAQDNMLCSLDASRILAVDAQIDAHMRETARGTLIIHPCRRVRP